MSKFSIQKRVFDSVAGAVLQESQPIQMDGIDSWTLQFIVLNGASLAGSLNVLVSNFDGYSPLSLQPDAYYAAGETYSVGPYTGFQTKMFYPTTATNLYFSDYRELKVQWVPSAGSGTIIVVLTGKSRSILI